jgi:oligoendopeptidase F
MNKEWSLDVLYHGYEDKNYQEDKARLQSLTKELSSFSETLETQGGEEANLMKAIDYLEQYQLLGSRLNYYVALRQSVNTSDSETVNEMNAIEKQLSLSSKPMAVIHKYIAGIVDLQKYMNQYPKGVNNNIYEESY